MVTLTRFIVGLIFSKKKPATQREQAFRIPQNPFFLMKLFFFG